MPHPHSRRIQLAHIYIKNGYIGSANNHMMNETPAGDKYADLSFMKVYAAGNPQLIKQLVNQFIEKTPASVSQMDEALTKADYHTLSRIAHSLKSQVAYMGAKQANGLIVEIEQDAKEEKRIDQLPQKIASLREMLHQVFSELQNQLQEL